MERAEALVLTYTARGIRGPGLQPNPHWLAHLLVREAVAAYRIDRHYNGGSTITTTTTGGATQRAIRLQAMALVRDLMVAINHEHTVITHPIITNTPYHNTPSNNTPYHN